MNEQRQGGRRGSGSGAAGDKQDIRWPPDRHRGRRAEEREVLGGKGIEGTWH